MRKFFAWAQFASWFVWSISSIPLFIISSILPQNARPSMLGFYMKYSGRILGIRTKKIGVVAKHRPLMFVCNHIGWFELFAMPAVVRLSFFGKAEIREWPVVGWIVGALGVVFVDRRPAYVKKSLAAVNNTMKTANYPVALFPEGTTTNGAYVKKFKSSLFNFIEPQLQGRGGDVAIQPVVQVWKYPDGRLIGDKDLANNYAYFNNDAVEYGPVADVQRSGVALAANVIARGGVLVEYHFLPVVDLTGITDRKALADKLQKIIADEYKKLRSQQ